MLKRRGVVPTFLAVAGLAVFAGCQIFAVRMPSRATAGSSIVVELANRQSLADGSPRPGTHCARFPSSWTVTASTYTRTVGGVASSGTLVGALAGEASTLMAEEPLAGHTWVCRQGPSTNYANGDFGTGRWTVTVQTPGTYDILFVTTLGDGTADIGDRATRRIVIDGIPDWRFDARSTTLPTEQESWTSVNTFSDLELVAIDVNGGGHITLDGGITWADNTIVSGQNLYALQRIGNYWIAVGSNGTIRASSTPLTTWSPFASGTGVQLNEVCHDGTTMYVVGNSGYVATTVNGTAFFNTTVAAVGDVLSCAAVPGAGAYATTSTGAVFKITHSGAAPTISENVAVAPNDLFAIAYVAAPTPKLVTVGINLAYERAIGAASWTAITTPGTKTPVRLRVFGDTLYVVGYNGLFSGTPTNTTSWTNYGSGTGARISDLAVTGKVAILAADGGVVLRVGIPEISFDGATLTLPRTAPGATGQGVMAMRNIGKGLLYTGTPVVTPPFTATHDCDGAIEESEECEISVSINTATRGVYTGTLTMPSSTAVQHTVTVQALVGSDATITATLDGTTPVTTVDFGSAAVGAPVSRTVLMRNAGDAPLTIATVGQLAVPAAPFAITDNQCNGQIIAAGATCPVTVRFQPFGQDGAAQAFDVTSNDPATPRLFVQLVGVGTPPADMRVDAALAFPDVRVRDSAEATLLIRNVGRGPLDIQSMVVAEGADDFTVVDPAAFTVAPGESAERKVRFAPGAAGDKTGRLVLTTNDPDAADRAVTMTAIALAESSGSSKDDGGCAAASPEWATLLAICAYAACRCAGRRSRRTAPSHA